MTTGSMEQQRVQDSPQSVRSHVCAPSRDDLIRDVVLKRDDATGASVCTLRMQCGECRKRLVFRGHVHSKHSKTCGQARVEKATLGPASASAVPFTRHSGETTLRTPPMRPAAPAAERRHSMTSATQEHSAFVTSNRSAYPPHRMNAGNQVNTVTAFAMSPQQTAVMMEISSEMKALGATMRHSLGKVSAFVPAV